MTEEEKKRIIDELELEKAYGHKFNNPQIKMITGCALKLIRYQDTEINKLNNVIDRIKWKPIKEYDRQKYDWVLVKYFDGDYECVPEVAEQRIDGKWYTSEQQIPFEVKYFFDMQILKEDK